jgi:hypothetical protein
MDLITTAVSETDHLGGARKKMKSISATPAASSYPPFVRQSG